jgi:predicted Rdx family selenoprotein
MLLQVIISVSLETLEDFCIGSFNLVVALWMSNRCIAYLNA